jgi:glycosyltransferase involved in cell wall biosynthesis
LARDRPPIIEPAEVFGLSAEDVTRREPNVSSAKVVFVTDIKTPYMVVVLEALARLANLTVLFCAESGSRGLGWTFERPLRFRHRTVGGLVLKRSPDSTDYHLSLRVLREIWRERPDAIITSGFSIPTLYAALVGAVRRCPMLIQSDGTSVSENALNPLQRMARTVLVPAAAGAVANSELSAARFAQLGVPPARIFVAPHTTDMTPLWEVARTRVYRPDHQLRVLAVGRLIPRKGLKPLIQAVRIARDAGCDVSLEIVGEGPEEPQLRQLTRELGLDDVRWRGFVEQSELPSVYAAADAFAFPTLNDPFGLVLLEAAATGLALVASPHGGATADIVREGETGFQRDPEDPTSWATALCRLAREPDLREAMGRAAYRLTLGRSPEVAAAGYAQALHYARTHQGRRGWMAGRSRL